jgi:hypothetical protein
MSFVFHVPLAGTDLLIMVGSLRTQGVSIYTYPLAVNLVTPQRRPAGAFGLPLTGPPEVYTILSSTDLAAWNQLGTLTNTLGAAVFTNVGATKSSQKVYRAMTKLP